METSICEWPLNGSYWEKPQIIDFSSLKDSSLDQFWRAPTQADMGNFWAKKPCEDFIYFLRFIFEIFHFKEMSKDVWIEYGLQCRAIGSFFMVGVLRKNRKKHWLKRPKEVPQKSKFGPKYKWFEISYCNSFFRNIILGVCNFFIFVHMFQWTSS